MPRQPAPLQGTIRLRALVLWPGVDHPGPLGARVNWQRQAGRWAATLTGIVLGLLTTPALAWGVPALAASTGTPNPGQDGGSGGDGGTGTLVTLVVAVALVGVAAWAALVLRGLSRPRPRSGGTPGRHRRDHWDEDDDEHGR